MKSLFFLLFLSLAYSQNCLINTFTKNYNVCSLVGKELEFSSGSNLWKINVFGTVESFEGCDAIQDNISAVRRFSISQGFYKCDYLSSSMHFVASGSETIVDSSSQGVYVKYNGGDVCNVDPTKTNEVITHFVCNNSAVKPVVTNVKLDYNSCLTEVFISTNASCASTMSTPFMWLVVLICCVVIVLIVVVIILVLRYRKIQEQNRKTQNKQNLL